MVAHITLLGVLQIARAALGSVLGAFLIYRSLEIPLIRESRLEEGDRAWFLVLGAAILFLAVLRGIQGGWTLRLVRAARGRARNARGSRRLLLFSGLAVLSVALVLLPVLLEWRGGWLVAVDFQGRPDFGPGPGWRQAFLEARHAVAAVLIGEAALWVQVLAVGLLRPGGRTVRRLGLFMAAVDLADLTGFPLSTGAGLYALLVLRHPDSLDFFEGIFSPEPRVEGPAAAVFTA